jgi:hypothetical protein
MTHPGVGYSAVEGPTLVAEEAVEDRESLESELAIEKPVQAGSAWPPTEAYRRIYEGGPP